MPLNYLYTYLSSIPTAQRDRLFNILRSEVEQGYVPSITNYEERLVQILSQLNTLSPQPSFVYREQAYRSKTSSYNIQDMETKAISDLEILYQEAVMLEQAITAHDSIVSFKLDSINSAIDRLEKEINAMEILAASTDGTVSVVFDSFADGDTHRLTRSLAGSDLWPFIIDGYDLLDSKYDAKVDTGELTLPIKTARVARLAAASISNQVPPGDQSHATVDTPTQEASFSLAQLLDNNPNTYWAETVSIETKSTDKATAELTLTLAGPIQANKITLRPFSRYPFKITRMQYKSSSGASAWTELEDVTYPVLLDQDEIVRFPYVLMHQLKLYIEQTNISGYRYIVDNTDTNIKQIFDYATGQMTDIAGDVISNRNIYYAMSSNMQRLLNVEQDRLLDVDTVNVYQFMYGFKEIVVESDIYESAGLFVSEITQVDNAGALGLTTEEVLPENCFVEYDALIDYYQEDGFSGRQAYNLLPVDTTMVNEILDGIENTTQTSWSCTTRFPVENTLTLYMNGTLLESSEYSTTTNLDGTATVTITNATIKNNLRRSSVFSCSYTPTKSTYNVTLDHNKYVKARLRVVLRTNRSNFMITPEIAAYYLRFKKYTGI
jgi:hypothetical protein